MDLIKELNKETLAREVPTVKIGDTVRVKLYYLRGRVGKSAKVKEKL